MRRIDEDGGAVASPSRPGMRMSKRTLAPGEEDRPLRNGAAHRHTAPSGYSPKRHRSKSPTNTSSWAISWPGSEEVAYAFAKLSPGKKDLDFESFVEVVTKLRLDDLTRIELKRIFDKLGKKCSAFKHVVLLSRRCSPRWNCEGGVAVLQHRILVVADVNRNESSAKL